MAGEHVGHRQRMRERFITQGLAGFADHEVLELMLFYAIPQRNVNPLAHQLIDHFGSLHGVLDASVEELMQVDGIGQNAAVLLTLFSHAARRLEMSRETELETMDNRLKAQVHCRRLLSGLKTEHFYAVCLNGQMQVIRDVLIARGTLGEVQAYPRLVVEAALRHNAHAVVLCHNHPGGQLSPSQADVDSTNSMALLLAGIGVALADHIIVCGSETLSMSATGYLTQGMPRMENAQAASSAGQVRLPRETKKRIRKE